MNVSRHLLPCLLLGCVAESRDLSISAELEHGSDLEATREATPTVTAEAAVPLVRGLGHEQRIVEVWLDAGASAAVSIDAAGSVRLWPRLPTQTEELEQLAPIEVPIREPRALSFARGRADDTFVLAALDTSQSARVIEIEIDASGQAGVRERFTIPPSDPLLELHVLEHGERLLGLGVDHRLRLYDGQGKQLSELREYGVAPWQLRLAGPPEAREIAMLLVQPTRLQRLSLADDRITKLGEPHAITLDRGPSLNDLALLPSGRTAAVLRRIEPRSGLWAIELHDLDTGGIRMLWGGTKYGGRPRMHVVDDDKVLLEGKRGDGYWVDLRAAVAMPAPYELPETGKLLPRENYATTTSIMLPRSSDARQVSVSGSMRIGPLDFELLVDPLDADHHHRLGHESFNTMRAVLDPSGTQLAMAITRRSIVITSLSDLSEQETTCGFESMYYFAFSDADHLVVLGDERATICAWRTGELVAELDLPSYVHGVVHIEGPGSGRIGIRETNDEDGFEATAPDVRRQAAFSANAFGSLKTLTGRELARWPEIDSKRETHAIDRAFNIYSSGRVEYEEFQFDTRHFDIHPPSGERRRIVIGEEPVELVDIEPSPDGRFVALVHSPELEEEWRYAWMPIDLTEDHPYTLTLLDLEREIPEPRWSAALDHWRVDLSWSDDSSRLAMDDRGHVRVISPDGEVLFDRRDRNFHVERESDPSKPASE
jgi:hypothetical protein